MNNNQYHESQLNYKPPKINQMLRLAFAIGFLAVFGLVGYAVIVLLTNHFLNKKDQIKTTIKALELPINKKAIIIGVVSLLHSSLLTVSPPKSTYTVV